MPNPALQKPPTFTLGKSLIALVNLVTLFGPYLADWNKTHIYNPNWPPHARYHNGQTMSLGLFVGVITFYILFFLLPSLASSDTYPPSRSPSSTKLQQVHLNWVLVLQNLMYISSLSGILYPGAGWTDPEFGDGKPQAYVFPCLVGVLWVGWWVERRRIERVAQGKKE
ncbi:uncharacterized protein M437DRAFT_49343 [Aureobasidium melanogenum CBS 110374]|uniref:DUF1648 domain-containing protein n=1 Tax=Aureobasidium melanogenum (strain CBS 110374) TaxID=1043003 RepID=A0A074VQ99_AURM1|nr:uncharacterized protein M437DRAFT_49343 [Aureobasidium melanogenum CBS 110374]KEQ62618.1 hypothetical protein M437DRAFT_49343 [Aureobasidium melanogenum CBS 110374]